MIVPRQVWQYPVCCRVQSWGVTQPMSRIHGDYPDWGRAALCRGRMELSPDHIQAAYLLTGTDALVQHSRTLRKIREATNEPGNPTSTAAARE